MNWKRMTRYGSLLAIFAVCRVGVLAAQPAPAEEAATGDEPQATESTQDGTVFGSMTIEAENKITITFARPQLDVDIDPENAPGLDWGSPMDVITRKEPDLLPPLLQVSAHESRGYLMRPWLQTFKSGELANFRPTVENVNNWRLTVVDNRGHEVFSYAEKGKPPERLGWDGSTAKGGLAWPGVTYSYVFEAFDRAGNKRRFVGDGFSLQPYIRNAKDGLHMLFAGQHLKETAKVGPGGRPEPSLLLEAASLINQTSGPSATVVVAASARNHATAEALGRKVQATLQEFVVGDPARIAVSTLVADDGPPEGAVEISVSAGS